MRNKKGATIRIFTLFMFIVFFSEPSFAAWTLRRSYNDVSIYTSENSTRLSVNYSPTKKKQKRFTKKLLKRVKKEKERMLQIIGVTDWQIDRQDLNVENGVTSIVMTGSYVDSSQDRVYFTEYHYYSDSKKLQILLTNNNKDSLERDARRSNVQEFRRRYGI